VLSYGTGNVRFPVKQLKIGMDVRKCMAKDHLRSCPEVEMVDV